MAHWIVRCAGSSLVTSGHCPDLCAGVPSRQGQHAWPLPSTHCMAFVTNLQICIEESASLSHLCPILRANVQTFAWTPWGLSMWQDTCKLVSPDDSPKLCWQGGTCVIVGDEHARVTEAAKAAERHLKCKVLRTSPFWSKEGFSQETYNEQVRDSTL